VEKVGNDTLLNKLYIHIQRNGYTKEAILIYKCLSKLFISDKFMFTTKTI